MLSDIVGMTGIPKQTINSALRKLEKEGFLHLETAGRRRKRVVLTESGKRLAEKTAGQMLRMEHEIFSSWKEEELAVYMELLQRYLVQLKDKAKEL